MSNRITVAGQARLLGGLHTRMYRVSNRITVAGQARLLGGLHTRMYRMRYVYCNWWRNVLRLILPGFGFLCL